LFPDIELVLIVDHPVLETLPAEVQTYLYLESKKDSDLFARMEEHSHFKFRKGFWKYTFLRLFALSQVHISKPNRSLIHIESDVILLPNFPWGKFKKLDTVSWMRVNDFNDVAALVYLPSPIETEFFIDSIRKYAYENPKITDMFAMFKFSSENKDKHSYLPSITSNRARSGIDFNQETLVELFGGYFDPLALGLWYFGQDPKNTYGVTRRYIDQTHHDYFAPTANLSFVNERLIDCSGVEVFALHVHSKDLSLFDLKWREALVKVLEDAKSGKKAWSFSVRLFIASIKDRSLRAHLWIFLARVPGASLLREVIWIEKAKNHVKKFFKIQF
jgi:hypothetical protein